MTTKFVFVTGGVVSSLGKGIAAASLAAILESRGLKVTLIKLDPYINVDPGTMSPFQHGEVFVTDDGAETDLDLGHYERFIETRMKKTNNFTTGRLLQSLSPYLQQVSWVLMECAPYPPLVKHKLDFDAALELIARFARHEDITDQLNRYQLTPAMVDELVEKIHLLKAFKTQRGAQRLLYSTSHHLNLLPGALRSHKEQIELRKVVKLARQVYREQRAAFIEWIGYLLVRSNTRNTGIPFTDPQMLQAFLSVTVLLLPATRIAIEVRCGAKQIGRAHV